MARKSSSSTPPSLKQSVLGFTSTKRASSAANANSKGKNLKKQPVRTISTPAPASKSASESNRSSISGSEHGPIEVSSSEEEASVNDDMRHETKEKEVAPKKKPVGKAKINATVSVRPGVFRSREGVENVEAGGAGENLDLQDKSGRWRKHYRAVKEQMGSVEPIHGRNQTKIHHILRVFDLSYQYGPCIGVSRLERWQRASALGLNPPNEVGEILLTNQGREQDEFSQSVFYGEV